MCALVYAKRGEFEVIWEAQREPYGVIMVQAEEKQGPAK